MGPMQNHWKITLLVSLSIGFLAIMNLVLQLDDRHCLDLDVMVSRHQDHKQLKSYYFNPWQYRVFSHLMIELTTSAYEKLPVKFPGITLGIGSQSMHIAANHYPYLLLRIFQNILLFAAGFFFYRKISSGNYILALLGITVLSFSLAFGNYNSDLSYNSYWDTFFYLVAAWAIISSKLVWIIPLSVLGALNRETSAFIPVLAVLSTIDFRRKLTTNKPGLAYAIIGGFCFLTVFIGLRMYFGYQSTEQVYGMSNPLEYLKFNVSLFFTWSKILSVFSVLPLIAIFTWPQWLPIFRLWFLVMVPLWVLFHFCFSVVSESRLFYPLIAIIFLPAVLNLVQNFGRPISLE
jgi:hypothetical protein